MLEHAHTVKEVCAFHDVPFLINDRPDVALAAGADGVHLGQDDLPPNVARKILGVRALIGLSTHAPRDLDASCDEPVDYVSAGPVVPTPTKPGRPGTGTEYISYAAAHSNRPVFVTGGVSPDTVPELAAAGARHFVVVRHLTESDDPRADAADLRSSIVRAIART